MQRPQRQPWGDAKGDGYEQPDSHGADWSCGKDASVTNSESEPGCCA
jgi:hypothetical protein